MQQVLVVTFTNAATAELRERLRQRGDPTPERFFDIFHHRLLTLFYRAWAQGQPTAQHDRPHDDRYAAWLGSAIGVAGLAPAADALREGGDELARVKVAAGFKLNRASATAWADGAVRGLRATYAATGQLSGPVIAAMSIEGRQTVCGQAMFLGATTMLIAPDAKAMAWLQQRQPRLYDELDPKREQLQDFAFFKRFSYGCKQVYSADRWALTGEAGLFLDPFYSPGSDFIAIGNTYITELVARDRAGLLLQAERVEIPFPQRVVMHRSDGSPEGDASAAAAAAAGRRRGRAAATSATPLPDRRRPRPATARPRAGRPARRTGRARRWSSRRPA